jgi:hypothetical protein
MDDQRLGFSPTGRDLAGGWLVCLAIAGLALASTIYRGMPPAATVITTTSTCPSGLGSICQSSAETAKKLGAVAGLHRLTVPILSPGERGRNG